MPGYGKQRERTGDLLSPHHAERGAPPQSRFRKRWVRMVDFTRVFIHGLDSRSGGTKGSFFRERYPEMLMTDYFGALEERMIQLEGFLTGRKNLILVGSSFGGLMETLFACRHEPRVRRLILLAPALGLVDLSEYYSRPRLLPVTLYP